MAPPNVRSRQRKHVTRRFRITRLRQLLQLRDRVVESRLRDEHPPEVESRDPERGLAVHGLPVFRRRRIELALAFEDLSEIVVRSRMLWIEADCLAIRVCGGLGLVLHREE